MARTSWLRWLGGGRVLALVLACLAAAGAPGASAQEGGYALGVGDKLRIAVWERPDLSGEFTIGPAATLSLPLLGRIPADGLTLAQLEEAIAERLTRAAGMREPRVTVDIVQFRPFFVLGGVENAGQYPWVSGMTVLHAISIAGGYRKADAQDAMLRLEALRARERLHLSNEARAVALARRARLVAEREDAREIVFSAAIAELAGAAKADELADHERGLMVQRAQTFEAELALLESQKSILGDEIRALEGVLASKVRQAELNQQEIAELDKLRQRDLVPITRTLALRRTAAELEGDRRQLTAFIARARQEMTKVDLSTLNLRKARNFQIAESLKQTDDELSQLALSSRAAAEQATRAEASGSGAVTRIGDGAADLVIVRRGPSGPREFVAADHTPVLPGDIVRVGSRPLATPDPGARAAPAP